MARNNKSKSQKPQSELFVLTKITELCRYISDVTTRSPKVFRMTYVPRLQNMVLDALELLYLANTYTLSPDLTADAAERLKCQRNAYSKLRVFGKILFMASEVCCITSKQFEYASKLLNETLHLLHGWKESDLRRIGKPDATMEAILAAFGDDEPYCEQFDNTGIISPVSCG